MAEVPWIDSDDTILSSLSKHFNMSNINLKDLNITAEQIREFISYQLVKHKNLSDKLQQDSNNSSVKPSFPVNLFRQFESSHYAANRTCSGGRWEDESVTVQDINWISSIYSGYSSTARDCDCYCNGQWTESLIDYKKMHGYIALVICLFGTLANIFNVIVLTRKEMSKAPINIILKWLAVTDIFVMLEYIPFSIFMYLGPRDYKYNWAVYMLIHMHYSQIFHTISISLTLTLAIWRYIAIKHPHGRMASLILSHCKEAIILSFIVAPILWFPTYFVFHINEKVDRHVPQYHVDANEDSFLFRINFWLHSVIIKLLPCFILTLISFVLIRVLYKASKRKIKLKGYSHQPTHDPAVITGNGTDIKASALVLTNNTKKAPRTDRRTDRTTMLLVAVLLLFLITEFPQGILGLLSAIMGKCFFSRCYSLFGELMDLLALINAAVGFVLYGLMSKQFRTSFKSLFLRRRAPPIEMTTKVTGVTTTCV